MGKPQAKTLTTLTSTVTTVSISAALLGGHTPLLGTLTFGGSLGGASGVRLMGHNGSGTPKEIVAAVTAVTGSMIYDAQALGYWEDVYLELTGTPNGSTALIPYLNAV